MAIQQKRLRDLLAALRPAANELGLTLGPVEWTGSGHYRMTVTRPDGSAFRFIMPYSPSCGRSTNNTIRNLKRLAKENDRAPL
jgi:hypothetical protein